MASRPHPPATTSSSSVCVASLLCCAAYAGVGSPGWSAAGVQIEAVNGDGALRFCRIHSAACITLHHTTPRHVTPVTFCMHVVTFQVATITIVFSKQAALCVIGLSKCVLLYRSLTTTSLSINQHLRKAHTLVLLSVRQSVGSNKQYRHTLLSCSVAHERPGASTSGPEQAADIQSRRTRRAPVCRLTSRRRSRGIRK